MFLDQWPLDETSKKLDIAIENRGVNLVYNNVLALDLGTKCGYAIFDGESIISGTKKLPHAKNIGAGVKFLEFRFWLLELIKRHDIRKVYYERVYRHLGTDAAHAFGGFMYHMAAVCEEVGIKYVGIPVGTIKKSATGKGNASKEEMMEFAKANGFNPVDDNHADALAILLTAINLLKYNDFSKIKGTSWRFNLTGGRLALTF